MENNSIQIFKTNNLSQNINYEVLHEQRLSKKVLNKGDSTNNSFNHCTETKVIKDTIPSYGVNCLPERYSQIFLKSLYKKTNFV